MSQKIQIRRDTAANWTSVNPVLAVGEPCFETDTGKLKIGDGRAWGVTPYQAGGGGVSSDDLALYVPKVNARALAIDAPESIKIACKNREVAGDLVLTSSAVTLKDGRNSGVFTGQGSVKLGSNATSGTTLSVSDQGLSLSFPDGTGCNYSQGAPLTTIGDMSNDKFSSPNCYITKAYADSVYAAASSGGSVDLAGYVPRVSDSPITVEVTQASAFGCGIKLSSDYRQYQTSLTLCGNDGFKLSDMRGGYVKTGIGSIEISASETWPNTLLTVKQDTMKFAVASAWDGPIDGGFQLIGGYPLTALVATDFSHFTDPLAYITSGYADATYWRIDVPLPTTNLSDYYTRNETEEKIRELSQPEGYSGQVLVKDDQDNIRVLMFEHGILKSV
jgi:hypothetical protein